MSLCLEAVERRGLGSGLLSLPGLNVVFLQFNGPVSAVNFVVETTGVTHRRTFLVPPPEGGGGGPAVGAVHVPGLPGCLGLAGG